MIWLVASPFSASPSGRSGAKAEGIMGCWGRDQGPSGQVCRADAPSAITSLPLLDGRGPYLTVPRPRPIYNGYNDRA